MSSSKSKIFFIHVPKTGGTSVAKVLRSQEKLPSKYPRIEIMRKFGGHYPDLETAVQHLKNSAENYDLVFGHYPYSLINLLPNFEVVTVLREPRSRFFSHLLHIKTHSSKFKNVPNEEIVNQVPMLNNTQVRFFCDNMITPTEGFNGRKLDHFDLDHAIRNLQKCSIVGTTDCLLPTVKLLVRKFALDDEMLQHANPGSYIEDLSVDEKIVHESTKLDNVLYKTALESSNIVSYTKS